jgi:hypothetical protein
MASHPHFAKKTARNVDLISHFLSSPTVSQIMISFTIVDEVGNGFACQLWPDDPQHQALASVIEHARRKQVQCTVAGYSVRKRQDQNNNERIQANFVVTDVTIPGLIAPPQVQQ